LTDTASEAHRSLKQVVPIADRAVVVAALRTLSPEHRDVILECYYRGASVAQAAETLGVSMGAVKSQAYYALKALRLALEEMGVAKDEIAGRT
jgi:RNA polymerase sigma-70 factor (ECF subfamily)